MNTQSVIHGFIFVCLMMLAAGCASTRQGSSGMPMTFGNSDNVQIVDNPVMMFHDVVVTPTVDGAELVGKMHVIRHTRYTPGHIDIAVVDNTTQEVKLTVTTDFNHRIAAYGRRDLTHPNNLSAELPGVNLEKVTVYVAYHPSNIDRQSRFDCGNNIVLAELQEKNN